MGSVEVAEIRQALNEAGVEDLDEVADNESLLEGGLLDSLKLIDVVEELQARFKVRIKAKDLTPTHFDSLSSMKAFLDQLLIGSEKS
ncbi:phosphopantetheine-binding protein [Sphingomonas aerophila]|uniref:Acyl carrier protein n=1 Tax=Sphingomonas aerophila TaxID=1344948 RepID=A0A7W9BGM0_9SPHN|nr:phosphopantetheine-binding protein [Sphingomonas aerophila]MBB5716875.1 acyl carrier protein [Sphingomonas aerophila]